LREKWGSSASVQLVILSEVAVREADGNAVEGPLQSMQQPRSPQGVLTTKPGAPFLARSLREKWGSSASIQLVILSEAAVREADDNAVEGPL